MQTAVKNILQHFLDHKTRPANSNSVAPVGEQADPSGTLGGRVTIIFVTPPAAEGGHNRDRDPMGALVTGVPSRPSLP